MDYAKRVSHDLTELTDHEMDAIQVGLILLANSATAGSISYPEYKKTGARLLGKLGVNGYSNHDGTNSTTT